MEKDNKKARDDARREYNDTVRVSSVRIHTIRSFIPSKALATFIRKRDPRYKSHLANQHVLNAAKASGRSSGSSTPRKQAGPSAAATTFVEQSWQKASSKDLDHADLEWAAAENEDEEEWECVACGKSFRSEAAWDSHERSKKHMQAVEMLKLEMLEEDEALGLDDLDLEEGEDEGQDEARSEGAGDDEPEEQPQIEIEKPTEEPQVVPQDVADAEDGDEADETADVQSRSRKKKKAKKQSRAPSPDPLPKTARKAKARRTQTPEIPDTPTPQHDPEEPGAGAEAVEDDASAAPGKPEMSKRDKRRAREAAKKAKEEEGIAAQLVRAPNINICSSERGSRCLIRPATCAKRSLSVAHDCSPTLVLLDMR